MRDWLWGRRVELPQRRAQRIQPRGMGKPVVLDGAPDCRRYCGVLVVREINCRHGLIIIIIGADIMPLFGGRCRCRRRRRRLGA